MTKTPAALVDFSFLFDRFLLLNYSINVHPSTYSLNQLCINFLLLLLLLLVTVSIPTIPLLPNITTTKKRTVLSYYYPPVVLMIE